MGGNGSKERWAKMEEWMKKPNKTLSSKYHKKGNALKSTT